MKRFATISVMLCLVAGAGGSELTDRIRADAQKGANALLNGDYATLIALTHPRIVAEMGGREAAVAAVAESMAGLKSEGVTLESVVIETPPQPVATGAFVAVLVPQIKTLRTPEGRFRHSGHLLAVSEDGGAKWSFIDASTLTSASLAEYFPALAGVLSLPENREAERLPD